MDGLRYLEAKLMALVTEVFCFAMHHVTVQTLKVILVVRRNVRIRRLDVLGLFNQSLFVMALCAGFDRRFLRIGLIRTMAASTGDAHRRVAISTELLVSSLGNAKAEHCAKEDREVERGLQHLRFPLVDSFFGVIFAATGSSYVRRASFRYRPRYVKNPSFGM